MGADDDAITLHVHSSSCSSSATSSVGAEVEGPSSRDEGAALRLSFLVEEGVGRLVDEGEPVEGERVEGSWCLAALPLPLADEAGEGLAGVWEGEAAGAREEVMGKEERRARAQEGEKTCWA